MHHVSSQSQTMVEFTGGFPGSLQLLGSSMDFSHFLGLGHGGAQTSSDVFERFFLDLFGPTHAGSELERSLVWPAHCLTANY